jgi:hypothetical protein
MVLVTVICPERESAYLAESRMALLRPIWEQLCRQELLSPPV